MAITNFIPEIWAAQLQSSLKKALVFGGSAVVNRNYEGQIANSGDTVHITSITRPTIAPYVKNVTVIAPETLTDATRALVIDQARYFAFEVDDVDMRQAANGGALLSEAADEAAKYRTEAKANADAAKRLADIEEAQKTEAQKLADRLAAAEEKATKAELKALRSDIAQAKGVPAGLLTGSTEEELNASADALREFRGEAAKPPAVPSAAGQGNVGKPVGNGAPQITRGELESMTPEQITQAKAEGRLDTLLGIR